jgi:hypothetical protein
MKYYKIILFAFSIVPMFVVSQEMKKDTIQDKPERPAFESATLITKGTNLLFNKNTLEVTMQHRFGTINGGTNDLAGIYGTANIRIGLSYAIHDRLTIGFGTTKYLTVLNKQHPQHGVQAVACPPITLSTNGMGHHH